MEVASEAAGSRLPAIRIDALAKLSVQNVSDAAGVGRAVPPLAAPGSSQMDAITQRLLRLANSLPLKHFEPTRKPEDYQLGQQVQLQGSGLFHCKHTEE